MYALAIATAALGGCSGKDATVGGAAPGATGATPDSVCAKLTALPCGPTECVQKVQAEEDACAGQPGAYQSLLDCMQGATFQCVDGEPNTQSCVAEGEAVEACANSAALDAGG
jgi:hypothetical protein